MSKNERLVMQHSPAWSAEGPERVSGRRRQTATETTNREAEYIDWLSKNRIPVVVKLVGGEEARGWIEYYDRDIIRLTRTGESNLFIYKERVKYLFEDQVAKRRNRFSSP